MKRYVKAAYDPSMPKWLRVPTKYNKSALESLKWNYAMAQAKFYKEPQPDSIPIYLLYEVYEKHHGYRGDYFEDIPEYVYIPEYSYSADNIYFDYGRTYRSVNTASKSRLGEHIADTVYMVAPKRSDAQADRNYVDPRHARLHGSRHWNYKGQYPEYETEYNGDTHQWEKTNKVYEWQTSSQRDKSGYAIPKPEELYAKLYARFPNSVQTKLNTVKGILDEYYDKIDAAKTLIFSQYDIRKGKAISMYGKAYDTPFYALHDAIYSYGNVYRDFEKCIKEDGSVDYETLEVMKAKFTEESNTLNPNVKKKTSFVDYYGDLVSQVANSGSVYKSIMINQQATVNATFSAREQVIGVSSDDELTNMVKFQNAYNASSRYINVISEMLAHLINTLGT